MRRFCDGAALAAHLGYGLRTGVTYRHVIDTVARVTVVLSRYRGELFTRRNWANKGDVAVPRDRIRPVGVAREGKSRVREQEEISAVYDPVAVRHRRRRQHRRRGHTWCDVSHGDAESLGSCISLVHSSGLNLRSGVRGRMQVRPSDGGGHDLPVDPIEEGVTIARLMT